jgi:hypothetical protein
MANDSLWYLMNENRIPVENTKAFCLKMEELINTLEFPEGSVNEWTFAKLQSDSAWLYNQLAQIDSSQYGFMSFAENKQNTP